MQQGSKGVGLNPSAYRQLTDHLAPLCAIMQIPLLVTNAVYAEEVSSHYPDVQILLIDWMDFNPLYLAENFDVFFQSEPWNRQAFYQTFAGLEKRLNKQLRNVHCPHGFSDKIFWLEKGVWEDILLVYGQNMIDQFKENDVEKHLNVSVRTGNYRYAYYLKHQAFYDELFEEKVGRFLNPHKKTILYAPTRQDQENSSTLFYAESLLKNLPSSYQMIIKVHPAIEHENEVQLANLSERYAENRQIFFLKNFSPIYPLLAKTDIYLGDRSSIGYDFLSFDRPLFFINHLNERSEANRNYFLYRCGIEIKQDDINQFYDKLDLYLAHDQQHFSKIRQEVNTYTFGESIPFPTLKIEIEKAYHHPKKYEI